MLGKSCHRVGQDAHLDRAWGSQPQSDASRKGQPWRLEIHLRKQQNSLWPVTPKCQSMSDPAVTHLDSGTIIPNRF